MGQKITLRALAAASAALALALTGCGDRDSHGDDSTAGYGEPSTAVAPTETDHSDDDWQGSTDELNLFPTDVGEVITDDDDRTLYMFTEDSGGTSACYDQCAENWPPVLAEGDVEVDDNLDPSLLGTLEREDGSTQITYNGHPLYYWAEDISPGDIGGQGRDDAWYVLDAEGEPVTGA